MKYTSPFKLKLIYVFGIPGETHKGCLKIGEATASDEEDLWGLAPNSSGLNSAAKKRINQYTQTAGIPYQLHYTELSLYSHKGCFCSINDSEVHQVLLRSGIKKKSFGTEHKANEWFEVDLETVKSAIKAAKSGRYSLDTNQITQGKTPIIFRPEQLEAISQTKRQFKKSKRFLWNAKMRFGKTLSAIQLVKEMNLKRTLILTHRPVVDAGWFEDFGKIFLDTEHYVYGSKHNGESFASLIELQKKKAKHYIYFASVQDLRGSELVGGHHDKNQEIFANDWDLIIVDEAHEGTQTTLGQNVLIQLSKKHTLELHLSGTPFNLLDEYKQEEVFTWDYVMEQRAKQAWDEVNIGIPNPYASLPRLNIFTYELRKLIPKYADSELAFNFREFFRVNEKGSFVHERDVLNFLHLMTKLDPHTQYPFSTPTFRQNFRHTLWMIPGVKEARALSKLLQVHEVFQHFNIVNVAGEGDEETDASDALKAVNSAIGPNPEGTYSITLSCGKLTTGVSVKAWTAVMMLAGSVNTSASTYMQTIFRVQTPAIIGGKQKDECFVFDFAPDRTLKVVAETAKISAKAGKTTGQDREAMGEFLNFCPIISVDGSRVTTYDTNKLLEELKKVYVEKVVQHGFEDNSLYNDELLKLSDVDISEFQELKKVIGSTKAMAKTNDIDLNNQGYSKEEYKKLEGLEKKAKQKKELTAEEKDFLEAKKKKLEAKKDAISILRGISIRMPLMIYGADLEDEKQEITIDNFAQLIDARSWDEFMPKRVSKQMFNSFKKYYDPEIFSAASKRIRAMARAVDALTPEERIERITDIFSTFRNPDKETVLTPWKVVNRHLSETIGGYCFFDEKFDNLLSQPRKITRGQATLKILAKESLILEVNSKSGLYPLYMTYSIYRECLKELPENDQTEIPHQLNLWDKVLRENIFVLCKTPMAKSITKRTLVGFRNAKVNTKHFEDLINQIDNKPVQFIEKVINGQGYWKANQLRQMKFNVVVGNPPYQVMDGGHGVSAKAVYHKFVDIAQRLNPDYVSMIMPSRWFAGGKGLDDFRAKMLKDSQLQVLADFEKSTDIFPNVDIAGGVCFFLWAKGSDGQCRVINHIQNERIETFRNLGEHDVFIRHGRAAEIVNQIQAYKENGGKTLADVVSSRKPFSMATNYKPQSSGIPCWFIQKIGIAFADPKDVIDKNGILDKWKLLIPKAPIAGQTDFSKPVGFYYDGNVRIAKPGDCCTESWLVAFAGDTEEEVLSFKSYLFTKIVRFLLLQAVVSQDVTRQNFAFVPDLGKYDKEFTDEMLRNRWGITDEQWMFIDGKIK